MNPDDYHLEFYDDGSRQPVRDWLEDLEQDEPAKHDALMYGLSVILARQGTNVCGTEFGKSLGKGLYEFRLRHTRDELQAKTQPHLSAKQPEGDTGTDTGAAPEGAGGESGALSGVSLMCPRRSCP